MRIFEILADDSKAYYIGNCKNSFDSDGDCHLAALPWGTVSDFAADEESAHKLSIQEFLKHVFVPDGVHRALIGHVVDLLRTESRDVYMIYDHDTDTHYFFIKSGAVK